ncbi:MAG: hypothetical protein ABSC54_01095 [Smithellaceae bacterium]|jgi:hypothetical protein
MKRFWLVLLSLGLAMAFSTSAFAVDVQFSGSYFAAGMYLDQVSLIKGPTGLLTGYDSKFQPIFGPNTDNQSTAFYFQRLRVRTDFIISPGLKLVTRFDALNRIWGGARSTPGTFDTQSAGTRDEEQNIAIDWAYIEYTSPIGLFQVGYGEDNVWGFAFGSSGSGPPAGQILYGAQIGPVTFGAGIYKEADNSYSAVNPGATATDTDYDRYVAFGIYNFKGGETGLLFTYSRIANDKQFPSSLSAPGMGAWGVPLNMGGSFIPAANMMYIYTFQPYFKTKLGPVALEGEFVYSWGSINMENSFNPFSLSDIQLQDIMAYLNAVVDLGVFYVGGTVAYMSGDDPNTTDRVEGNVLGGGMDWNPCLIMFNQDLTYWVGPLPGFAGTSNFSGSYPNTGYAGMTNAWFFQLKGGLRPIPKMDIAAAVSYAMADQVPTGFASNKSYGWELDVTGTYKITNNLSYLLGVGYWWVGDYYKGLESENNHVRDEYMVINKLTLTF